MVSMFVFCRIVFKAPPLAHFLSLVTSRCCPLYTYPPPPAQEPPCARTAPWFRGQILAPLFFTTVLGFSWFWWMQDSYSGVQDNISCVLLGVPPSWGDPISQSQAHIPLKPLPPALDPLPKATSS